MIECVVTLRKGECIRPDAARLVRTRPGWSGNPNATQDGVPGFGMNWLEIEGPLTDQWPPASYQALFGDLPFDVIDGQTRVTPRDASKDAERLLIRFYTRAIGPADADRVEPFVAVFNHATELDEDFTDAMMSAMSVILCSPEFLYFDTASW